MSASPTKSQNDQFDRIIASAGKKARKGLDREAHTRFGKRRGEFDKGLDALVKRLAAPTPDYTLARSILGGDFISPEEIMTARPGIIYSDDQIAALADMMPSEEALRWCKDNGFAVVAAPPRALSLLNIRMLEADLFYSKTGGWYAEANQKFASDDKTSVGWLMIRKTDVPKSHSKNWTEQSALLSNVEYVPNAAKMSWFITTFYKVRGIRLFENVCVRTSSVDANGDRVCLGCFDAGGLVVSGYWGDVRDDYLGVASGRKA
ncbi:MAG: hypothetical protein KGI73_01000 [Patescibacteria group bacterium]|nr:hypothetical protein [Patescibacteria group bacterium]